MVLRSFILVTVLATLAVAGPLLGGCGGAPQNEQNTILSVCEVMRSLDKFGQVGAGSRHLEGGHGIQRIAGIGLSY